MGKGSAIRPKQITSAEESVRWDLYLGRITKATFDRRFDELKQKGMIRRSGRVLK